MDILGKITGLDSTVKPINIVSSVSTNALQLNSSNTLVKTQPINTVATPVSANVNTIKSEPPRSSLSTSSVSLQGVLPFNSCIPVSAMYNKNAGYVEVLTPIYLSSSITSVNYDPSSNYYGSESTCVIN